MTSENLSATLYREGPDLDSVLAALDIEYPGRVRVVDVTYGRDGGVMGFFAKRSVGVHFVLDGDPAQFADAGLMTTPYAPMSSYAPAGDDWDNPIAALMAAADAADAAAVRAVYPEVPADGVAVAGGGVVAAGGGVVAAGGGVVAAGGGVVVAGGGVVVAGGAPAPSAERSRELAAEIVASGAAPDPGTDTTNVEFARMLLEIASQKAAERQAAATSSDDLVAPQAAGPTASNTIAPNPAPTPAPTPVPTVAPASVTSTGDTDAAPLTYEELLRQARRRPVGAHRASSPEDGQPSARGESGAELSGPAPVRPAGIAPSEPVQASEPVQTSEPAETSEAAEPVRATAPPATAPPATGRTPLTLRRQLTELGIPLNWIPDGADNAYAVIEQVVASLPTHDVLDLGPGRIVAVVGPGTRAMAEARRIAARLRLAPEGIRRAGGPDADLRTHRDAAALELEVRGTSGRSAAEPCIVVVSTDASEDLSGTDDLTWAARVLDALGPDELVMVIDASSRVTDVRVTLADLRHRVTALAVTGAARTPQPAALWEIGVPVASLDGRPAGRGTWAALLIDRLTRLDS